MNATFIPNQRSALFSFDLYWFVNIFVYFAYFIFVSLICVSTAKLQKLLMISVPLLSFSITQKQNTSFHSSNFVNFLKSCGKNIADDKH